jgi:Cys-rich protein (TIGR01571 family)
MSAAPTIKAKLAELDSLLSEGIISKEEYQEARKHALGIPAENSNPAVMGAVVGGQVTGNHMAIGCTQTDKVCYKDHKMAFLQNAMVPFVGEGAHSLRRVVCGCCMTQIELGAMYYMCGKCIVPFCQSCVDSGKYRRTSRDWHTGLFGCFEDTNSCMDDLLCNYCMQGVICDRAQRGFETSPTEKPIETGCTGRNILLGCGLFWYDVSTLFIFNIFTWVPRQQIVRKYGIEENGCKTCLAGYFCRPCAECQIHREMTIRGAFPGGIICATQPNQKLISRYAAAPTIALMTDRPSAPYSVY